MGRFINADAYASTGQGVLGNNMFAYCLNNPITYADPSGHISGPRVYPVLDDGGDAGPAYGLWHNGEHLSETARKNDQAIFSFVNGRPLEVLAGLGLIAWGIVQIDGGLILLLTPVPTLANEIYGLGFIWRGGKKVLQGLDIVFNRKKG